MKKFFTFVLIIFFGFILTSCEFPTEHNEEKEKPNENEQQLVDEYDLKVSRLLNNVKKEKSGSLTDEEIKNQLVNASFKLYNILSEDVKTNYCISPVSIYLALSLLYLIGDSTVKEEIGDLLDLSQEAIAAAGIIYEDLTKTIFKVQPVTLSNSIWLDKNITTKVNQDALNELAEKLFCYAYETTFLDDNQSANKDIREFVKQQTHGLIDNDFNLSPDALFVLINTLYFKDNWQDSKPLATDQMKFKLSDGTTIELKDVISKYQLGLAYTDELGSSFYTTTECGYKLIFLVPSDKHEVSELMNAEYFNTALKNFSNQPDSSKDIIHKTRTIFPAFNVKTEIECQDAFSSRGYLSHTFSYFESNLIENPLMVSRIIHQTNLTVDEEGIVGAAVTIIEGKNGSSMPINTVYHDFIVDKEFGYVITSTDGIVLFMGQITNPSK